VGPDWAIAGRIATRLHAARLDARTPSDEDPASIIEVVIRRDPRESLQRALHEAGHVGEVRYEALATQAPASFDLPAGLTVHVMRSDENRWGSIDDAEWHGGVPMISVAARSADTARPRRGH